MRHPLVIAHRGNSSRILENSLESIRSAVSLSVDMIEVDIRISRDRQLYVMHDKTTGRTAEENIDLENATAAEINRIQLKNGEPVPTLAAMLTALSGACGLNLEIKSRGAGALTAKYLRSSPYLGYILLSSFDEEEVLAARRVAPALATSVVFDTFTIRDVSGYRERGYDIVSLRKKTVDKALINKCHDQGIRVYVWTVDDEREMKKLLLWGADGIYSNKPELLKEVVRNAESCEQNTAR